MSAASDEQFVHRNASHARMCPYCGSCKAGACGNCGQACCESSCGCKPLYFTTGEKKGQWSRCTDPDDWADQQRQKQQKEREERDRKNRESGGCRDGGDNCLLVDGGGGSCCCPNSIQFRGASHGGTCTNGQHGTAET